jgi:predicted short-subunit dehydrogenase-like oxidoreductase (DUF2520 family)
MATKQPSILVVGAGKAGATIAAALATAGWATTVLCRAPGRASALRRWFGNNALQVSIVRTVASVAVDVPVLFATADRDLAAAAAQIAASGVPHSAPWLHLSGVAPPAILDVPGGSTTTGSCHPLCAILGPADDDRPLAVVLAPLQGALFALAGDPPALRLGHAIASACGGLPHEVATDVRAAYHAAASVVANDLVGLLAIGEKLCHQAGLPEGVARPALLHLARTSLDALALASTRAGSSLADGLTGAVGRGDAGTLQAHFDAMSRDPAAQHAHALLSSQLVALVRSKLAQAQHDALTTTIAAVLAKR